MKMNLFADIKSPLLLRLKAGLFGLLAGVSAVIIVMTDNRAYKIALLAVCVWSACRLYYFFFYVLDHYVGGNKNASIFAMIRKLPRKTDDPAANLFAGLPRGLPEELTETLAASRHVRIERIISTGQASPDGFWYDQAEHEWVVVLWGEAVLEFFEKDKTRPLAPGDYVLIPPHEKHRVASTSPHEPTVWLAVFFTEPDHT